MPPPQFYGPKIGALYARDLELNDELTPMIYGGGQERGRRAGTENVPMVVGLGAACDLVCRNLQAYRGNMEATRNYLEEQLKVCAQTQAAQILHAVKS